MPETNTDSLANEVREDHAARENARPLKPGSEPADKGFDRRIDARLIASIVACAIMSFCGVTVETAMNVTFPTLMAEFSIDTATVQWITTAYLLVLSAVIPTSSFLSRRFRTRTIFAAAVAFSLAGILFGATASSFAGLLVGRLLQGIGTGMALPLMFAVITEQTPYRNMGLMTGIGSLVVALAPAIGPSLGGFIAEHFGWRWIFWCLLPFVLVSLALGFTSIRQSHQTSAHVSFDLPGWLLLAGAFSALVIFTARMGQASSAGADLWGLALAFAVLLAAFIVRERRAASPLVQLSVFARRGFAFSALSMMLLQFVILGLGYLIPNYSQLVIGTGATEAGSLLLPGCLLGAALAPISGRLLDRLGARKPILFGAVVLLGGVILLSSFSAHLTSGLAAGFYMLVTLGQGLMVGNTMTNGLSYLEDRLKPDGNATINTLQQLAGALGTGTVTAIVNSAQASAQTSAASATQDLAASTLAGSQTAYLVLVGVAAALLVCQAIATGSRSRRAR